MRLFILAFVVIVQLLLALEYDYNLFQICVLVFNIAGTIKFLKVFDSLKSNFAILFLFVFIFCSLHVEALFKFQGGSYTFFSNPNTYRKSIHDLAYFANELLGVFYFSYYLFRTIISYKQNDSKLIHERLIGNWYIISSLIFAYIFSLISYKIGSGKMGFETSVVLPFKLNGIMRYYCTDIFPLIITIYFFDRLIENIKLNKLLIISLLLWALLESFIRLSRAAFFFSFLPSILMVIFIGRLNMKSFIRSVLPLLIISMTLFPIISSLRESGGSISKQSIKGATVTESQNSKQHAYMRTFYSGYYFMKIYPRGYDETLFCFKRAPRVWMLNGSATYITRDVDNVPETVIHSSGTSGILDPLIIGGKGLCYILISLLVLGAIFIDKRIGNEIILYKVICLLIFKTMIQGANISMLLSSDRFQVLLSFILQFYIVSLYYKKCFKSSR